MRKENVWKRRRKHDGFVLLLAHPCIAKSATELATHYRGKDVVEKGFQTIKSFVRLGPVFHYTDPKVQAHLTICMLALTLMRTLTQQLNQAGIELSGAAALELLADCRLEERISDTGLMVNHPTKLHQEQKRILSKLNFESLADLNTSITARKS